MPKYSDYSDAGTLLATDLVGISRSPFTANTFFVTTPVEILTYSQANASGSWGISVTGTSANVTGVVAIAHGGTNSSTALNNNRVMASSAGAIAELGAMTNGQLIIGSTGSAPSISALTGTADQVIVTNTAGAITLSLPQNIDTTATPTFIGLYLTANAAPLVFGSASNTMTFFFNPALTGTNTFTMPSANCNPVQPLSSATTNAVVQYVDGTGTQNLATLTAGTGVSITQGSGTITIASSGAIPWVDETGSSVTMTTNTGYTSDDGSNLVTFTLPTTSAIGDFVEINGKGSGLWTIAQAAGQQIHFGTSTTTSGTGGSLSSINQYDCVRLKCLTANTIWTVFPVQGNLTVV
jgi:hypothetical protein